MQLTGVLLAAALAAIVAPTQAGICLLSLPTGGSLGMSPDGLRLGSEEGGLPVAATLTVASVGTSTLTVDPPVWSQTPPGYSGASELREVSYSAPVSGGAHGYTSEVSAITVPNLINAIVMTVNTRVTNPAGFADGTYSLRTVITCS